MRQCCHLPKKALTSPEVLGELLLTEPENLHALLIEESDARNILQRMGDCRTSSPNALATIARDSVDPIQLLASVGVSETLKGFCVVGCDAYALVTFQRTLHA